jgi:hypothetical protein
MLKMKAIPVIIWATGTISKSLRKYLNNISGACDIWNYRKQPNWALLTCFKKY